VTHFGGSAGSASAAIDRGSVAAVTMDAPTKARRVK
jgi:hypothetical protein